MKLIGARQFSPLLGAFNVLWGLLFVIFWRRRSSALSLAWGTWQCERSERVRYQFYGDPATDVATGEVRCFCCALIGC